MAKEVTRSIRLNFKINEDEFFSLENDFNAIHHYLGGKEPENRLEVWKAGIEAMLKQVAQSASSKAKDAAKRAALLEKTRSIKKKREDWRLLEEIFDSLTAEEFSQWCTENDMDINGFLEWRESKQVDSQAQDFERWLAGVLHDGEPIPTVAIKQQAILEGIIDDNDPQQWSYMRVIAGRKGYISKRRGYWQNGFHGSDEGDRGF